MFVHDGAVVLPGWGLEELQLDQVLGGEGLARAGVHLVPLDEGHDVDEVKDIALVITVGVLKRLKAESTVVEGQPFVVNLKAMKASKIVAFIICNNNNLFWINLSVPLVSTKEVFHLLCGQP